MYETLNVGDGSIVSAAIAADNVVIALYFAFLFYIAIAGEDKDEIVAATESKDGVEVEKNIDRSYPITMQSLSVSITVASCLVIIGKMMTGSLLPAGSSVSPFAASLSMYLFMLPPLFLIAFHLSNFYLCIK